MLPRHSSTTIMQREDAVNASLGTFVASLLKVRDCARLVGPVKQLLGLEQDVQQHGNRSGPDCKRPVECEL